MPGIYGQGGRVDREGPVRDQQPLAAQPVLVDWPWVMVFSLRVFHCAGTRPSTRFPLIPIQLSPSRKVELPPKQILKPITGSYQAGIYNR